MPAPLPTMMWAHAGLPSDIATSYTRARSTLFIKFMSQAGFVALAFAHLVKTRVLMRR